MRVRLSLIVVTLIGAGSFLAPAWATFFSFSTGNPDGRLGALSRPASTGNLETETADDFILTDTTVIRGATITGLAQSQTPWRIFTQVEIELYHVFQRIRSIRPSGRCRRGELARGC
jgi:hypothetical protein